MVVWNAAASNRVWTRWFWAALVVAVLSGAQYASAQVDFEPGEVSGVRLSSDAPGELTIVWDESDPTPTDYRVTWALAEEGGVGWGWLTFSAENEADRGNAYPTGTTLTLSGLGGGVEYKVQLRARYYDGDNAQSPVSGPWTDAVQLRVRAEPPAAPSSLVAVAGDGDVALSWTAPVHDQLTGYRILRGASADVLETLVADTGGTDAAYVDGTVEAATAYHYAVVALSADGPSPQSDTRMVTTEAAATPTAPPAAPTGLSAVESGGRVVLDWDDPPATGTDGSANAVTGYRVLRGVTAKKLATIANNTRSTDTQYTDTTAEPDTTYYYAVVARNTQGASPRSATAKITTKPADQQQITTRLFWIVAVQNVRQTGVGAGTPGVAVATSSHTTTFESAGTTQAPLRTREIAVSFTTGDRKALLDRLGLGWGLAESITARIHGDDNGKPKIEAPGSTVVDGSLHTCTAQSNTVAQFGVNRKPTIVCGNFSLAKNTKYWIVFKHNSALSLQTTPDDWEYTPSDTSDWSIGNNFYHKLRDSDTWTQHAHTLRMTVGVRRQVTLDKVEIVSSPRYVTGYETGDDIVVEFTFSHAPIYRGGVAALWLIDGDGNSSYRSASYHSGSGQEKTLTYRYKVRQGDVAVGGVSVGSEPLGNTGLVDSTGDPVYLSHDGVDGGAAQAVRGVAAECGAGVVYCGRAELVPNPNESGGRAKYWWSAGSLRTVGSLSRRGFVYGDLARSSTWFTIESIEADSASGNELSVDLKSVPLRLTHRGTNELIQDTIDLADYHINSLTLVIDRDGKRYDFSDARIEIGESTFGGNHSRLVWEDSGQDWRDLSRVDFRIVHDTLAHNLYRTSASQFNDVGSRDEAWASMFRTGDSPRGWEIADLVVDFESYRGALTPSLGIYSDADGSPGEPLATFPALARPNGSFLRGTPVGVFLSPNEDYWVVMEDLDSLRQGNARAFQCDGGQLDWSVSPGWGFGSQILARRGGAWTRIVDGRVLCMLIRGGSPRSNVAAAGGPVVRGVAEEGFPLVADVGGIVDPNGLPDPARRLSEYSFQWFRVDGAVEALISGATSQSYVAAAGDVGKRLKVTVGVTDLAGHAESVSSGLSAVVGPAAGVLVANVRAVRMGFSICTDEAAGEAVSVSTGRRAVVLHAVRIALAANGGAVPQVKIFSDASGLPGTDLHTLQEAAAFDNIQRSFEEFTSSGFTLEANTIYWVVYGDKAQDPDGSGSVCGDTTLDVSEDPGGFAGWSIGNATAELDVVWGTYNESFGVPRLALVGAYPTDAPNFAGASRNFTVAEGAAGGTVVGTAAARYDGDETLVYAVGGTDAAAFANSFDLAAATGQITVKAGATVDFEARQVYSVTVSVSDGVDEFGEDSSVVDDSIPVWVTVANADEAGALSLSVTSPVVGEAVSGTVSDPDGGVRNVTWQWSRADTADGVFADISGATSARYVPGRGDSGKFLRATAAYEDRHGSGKTVVAAAAESVVSVASNNPPSFPPLFTVAEDASAGAFVGDASATDPDGDPLTYTVSGADRREFNDHFVLGANSGRITVKRGARIDFETRSMYSVTVHVSDRKSASGAEDPPRREVVDASMPIRITVRNVDDGGSVTLSAKQPLRGVQLTASLVDPDGDVRDVSWEWLRGDSRTGAFAPISGAGSVVYRPVGDDVGKYLKARAAYSDGHLTAKTAEAASEHAVRDRQSRQERAGVTVSSLDSVGSGAVEVGAVAGGRREVEVSFRTGRHPGGYELSEVRAAVGAVTGGVAAQRPRVRVYADSGGSPGALVAELGSPSGFAADSTVVFSVSSPVVLRRSARYWLRFDNDLAVGATSTSFELRRSSGSGGGCEGELDWSVGDGVFPVLDGAREAFSSGTLAVAVVGSQVADAGESELKCTDTPADRSTYTTIAVGGYSVGAQHSDYDKDWFRVELTGGVEYQFDVFTSISGGGSAGAAEVHGVYDVRGVAQDIARTETDPEYYGTASGSYYERRRAYFTPAATGAFFAEFGPTAGKRAYHSGQVDSAQSQPTYLVRVRESDDYTADTATTGTVAADSSVRGHFFQPHPVGGATAVDTDWIRVPMTAGLTHRLTLNVHATPNTQAIFAGIYNSGGTKVADGAAAGRYSTVAQTRYTPASSGDYYVALTSAQHTGGTKHPAPDYTFSVLTLAEVSFGASSHTAAEAGADATVTVTLSGPLAHSVTIPITAAPSAGVTPSDYTGVPPSVIFAAGQTWATFTVVAAADSVDEDNESLALSFGPLPDGVTANGVTATTVHLSDYAPAAISGTARAAHTLTADTADIDDRDGLPASPAFSYQWVRIAPNSTETDITGATASAHTLVDADAGNRIRVNVSFTDSTGNAETRTSLATSVVGHAAQTLVTNFNLRNTTYGYVSSSNAPVGVGIDVGAHSDGYRISRIRWRLQASGSFARDQYELNLHTFDNGADYKRGSQVARLQPTPGIVSGGDWRHFWAQSTPKIDADTNSAYDLSAVITESASGTLACQGTVSDNQSGLSGWAISDQIYLREGTGITATCGIEVYGVRNVDAAYITSLSFGGDETTDGDYQTGDTLEIVANFSETVTVQGAPTLSFDIGTGNTKVTRTAVYDRAASTATALTFKYTITAADPADTTVSILEHAIEGSISADVYNPVYIEQASVRVKPSG